MAGVTTLAQQAPLARMPHTQPVCVLMTAIPRRAQVDHSAVIMYPGNLTIPKRCELPGEAWIHLALLTLVCRLQRTPLRVRSPMPS